MVVNPEGKENLQKRKRRKIFCLDLVGAPSRERSGSGDTQICLCTFIKKEAGHACLGVSCVELFMSSIVELHVKDGRGKKDDGHLMRRAASFEKTLMLGKIEGKRRS